MTNIIDENKVINVFIFQLLEKIQMISLLYASMQNGGKKDMIQYLFLHIDIPHILKIFFSIFMIRKC